VSDAGTTVLFNFLYGLRFKAATSSAIHRPGKRAAFSARVAESFRFAIRPAVLRRIRSRRQENARKDVKSFVRGTERIICCWWHSRTPTLPATKAHRHRITPPTLESRKGGKHCPFPPTPASCPLLFLVAPKTPGGGSDPTGRVDITEVFGRGTTWSIVHGTLMWVCRFVPSVHERSAQTPTFLEVLCTCWGAFCVVLSFCKSLLNAALRPLLGVANFGATISPAILFW